MDTTPPQPSWINSVHTIHTHMKSLALLMLCALMSTGCRQSIDAGASLIKTTVVTGGKLGVEGVKAAGSVAKAGLDGTARVLTPGVVAVINESGKTVRKMPWERGMTLYAAAKEAQLDAAAKTIQLLRGREIYERSVSDMKKGANDIRLRRGDRIKFLK